MSHFIIPTKRNPKYEVNRFLRALHRLKGMMVWFQDICYIEITVSDWQEDADCTIYCWDGPVPKVQIHVRRAKSPDALWRIMGVIKRIFGCAGNALYPKQGLWVQEWEAEEAREK